MVSKYIQVIEFIKYLGKLTRPIVLKADIIIIIFNFILFCYFDIDQVYTNSLYLIVAFVISRVVFVLAYYLLKYKLTYFRLQRVFVHAYGFELCIYEV